jgi:hypothetical protein
MITFLMTLTSAKSFRQQYGSNSTKSLPSGKWVSQRAKQQRCNIDIATYRCKVKTIRQQTTGKTGSTFSATEHHVQQIQLSPTTQDCNRPTEDY